MKVIHLTQRTHNDWNGKFLDEDSYDLLVNEDTTIYKPDGTLLAIVLKNALDKEFLSKAYGAFKDINIKTANRGTASGVEKTNYVRKDGTISNYSFSKEPVDSGVIGFFERTPRMPYCRACAWNLHNPEKFNACLPMIQQIWGIYEKQVPDRFKNQKETAEKTSQDFVVPNTGFTTITINKNFRTACHTDVGNLKDGFSCLNVIRKGVWKGANLVFPDFRVGAHLDSGDLIFFDPFEFHGNTPLVKLTKDAERWSLVYYYREDMVFCGTAEEELDRVKMRKKGETLSEPIRHEGQS